MSQAPALACHNHNNHRKITKYNDDCQKCPHPTQAEFYNYVHDWNWCDLDKKSDFIEDFKKFPGVIEVVREREKVFTDVTEAEKRVDFLEKEVKSSKMSIEKLYLIIDVLDDQLKEQKEHHVKHVGEFLVEKLTWQRRRKNCELLGSLKREEGLIDELNKARRSLFESNIVKQTFLLDKNAEEIYRQYELRREQKYKLRLKREEMMSKNASIFYKRFEKRVEAEESRHSAIAQEVEKKYQNMQESMAKARSYFYATMSERKKLKEAQEKEKMMKNAQQLQNLQNLKDRIDSQREILRLRKKLEWEKAEDKSIREEAFRKQMAKVLEDQDNPFLQKKKKAQAQEKGKIKKSKSRKITDEESTHTGKPSRKPSQRSQDSQEGESSGVKSKEKKVNPLKTRPSTVLKMAKEKLEDQSFLNPYAMSVDAHEEFWLVDFGYIPLNMKSFKNVTFKNPTEFKCPLLRLKIDILNPYGPFEQCNALRILNQGQETKLKFKFTPTETKKYEEYISIVSDGGGLGSKNSKKINLILTGFGILASAENNNEDSQKTTLELEKLFESPDPSSSPGGSQVSFLSIGSQIFNDRSNVTGTEAGAERGTTSGTTTTTEESFSKKSKTRSKKKKKSRKCEVESTRNRSKISASDSKVEKLSKSKDTADLET